MSKIKIILAGIIVFGGVVLVSDGSYAGYLANENYNNYMNSGHGQGWQRGQGYHGQGYQAWHSPQPSYSPQPTPTQQPQPSQQQVWPPGGWRSFSANLSGTSEVPGPADTDGTGTAYFMIHQGHRQICTNLEVSKIATASAAHIHNGSVGVAGPIALQLPTPTDGTAMNCMYAPKDTLKDIRKNPEQYYVNVHNSVYPDGAIRGQLDYWGRALGRYWPW